MTEPWNLKIEDKREADTLTTFIIFCEDEVSEPIYFKFFETAKIKINTIPNQKNMIDNVLNAICHCKKHGVMDYKKGSLCVLDEDVHIWCVFDRDSEEDPEKKIKGDFEFDESIAMAESKGINVAYSNDSFELWILLHFEEIDPTDTIYSLRQTYYDKLTSIFKSHPNPNADLEKALIHKSFNYKKDLKQKNNFRLIVRSEIISKTNLAIKRAYSLECYHNEIGNIHHEKKPFTLVHHLVEQLIFHGQKSL